MYLDDEVLTGIDTCGGARRQECGRAVFQYHGRAAQPNVGSEKSAVVDASVMPSTFVINWLSFQQSVLGGGAFSEFRRDRRRLRDDSHAKIHDFERADRV